MPLSGQGEAAATTSIHATRLLHYASSQLIQHCRLSKSISTNQLMTSPIGLRAKHLVTPPAKPTCTLVSRSGPSGGKEFVAANAFQLFNATAPTIFVVNILLMLCCGPIPPGSVRRKPNLETAQTSPIKPLHRHPGGFLHKAFVQPPSIHVHKNFPTLSACQVCNSRAQTILFMRKTFRSPKMLCKLPPTFPALKGWLSSLPESTSSLVSASSPR